VIAGAAAAARLLPGVQALVVDDCEIVQGIVRRLLEAHGALVECLSDGAAAVGYVQAHAEHIDIVLMDVQMPILDGNAATRRIRGAPGSNRLPIVGLTACALLSEQQCSLDAGMNEIITKPFDPPALVREIHRLVRRWRRIL
jgi:CheY-like chemotaxis protein